MFRRRNRALIARVLLALALLVAQSAAQAHLYSHRLDVSNAPSGQVCGECLCSAPLLAAAGSPAESLLLPRAEGESAATPARVPIPASRRIRPFQSRAPPIFL